MKNESSIRSRRNAIGKTQAQVAAAAEITVQYFQRVEAELQTPSVEIGQRIARALESTVEELWPLHDEAA